MSDELVRGWTGQPLLGACPPSSGPRLSPGLPVFRPRTALSPTSLAPTVSMSSLVPNRQACAGVTGSVMHGCASRARDGMRRLNSWCSRPLVSASARTSSRWLQVGPNLPVLVTASPAPFERHGPHLEKMAAAKARQYNTASWGRCHEDAIFVALVHDAQQHWLHPDALRPLHRLVMAVARRTAPEAPRAWGFHLSPTLLQCAAPVLHAAYLSAWQMHAACGSLL